MFMKYHECDNIHIIIGFFFLCTEYIIYEICTKIINKSLFASQQSVVYSQLISCIIIVFRIPMAEA